MPRIAFLFPGQGAQAVGMAKALAETVPAARRLFDEATAVLEYDLAEVCFNGPAERLNSTVVSQPAIYVASLAALETLKATDPSAVNECEAAAGLSLGEYTALVFAGVMDFAVGLKLVQKRGEGMQAAADATPSGMVSVIGLDAAQIEEVCAAGRQHGTLEIANLLCPGNTVLSGSKKACDAVEKLVDGAGGRAVRLAVAGAFHTDLMKPADEKLAQALAGAALRPGRIPVWSNVDAQAHTDPAEIRDLLIRQVLNPVLWEQTLRNLLAAGFDKFYEIGPGRVLAGLLKRVQRKTEIVNITA
jgi:[acyl-carrier-protein] S-malonyltransferase